VVVLAGITEVVVGVVVMAAAVEVAPTAVEAEAVLMAVVEEVAGATPAEADTAKQPYKPQRNTDGLTRIAEFDLCVIFLCPLW
jgi:hypothetical protein